MPVDANNQYDIMLDDVGYMLIPQSEGRISEQDLVPATVRSAGGEGRNDRFQSESYHAQVQFSGGVGQQRLEASDQILTGIGDGRSGGQFFPPRKKLDETDGGTTSYYFERAGTLYGMTSTAIEEVGTATSFVRTAGTVSHQPFESGNENVFWVQDESGTKKLYRWTGTGAAADITPTGYDPLHVTRFGRNLLLFAESDVPTTVSIVQSASRQIDGDSDSSIWSLGWDQPTKPGSLLLMIAAYGSANSPVPASSAWGSSVSFVYNPNSSTSIQDVRAVVWEIPNANQRVGIEMINWEDANAGALFLVEVAAVDTSGAVEAASSDSSKASESTALTTDTLGGTSTGSFRLSVMHRNINNDIPETITHAAGWTEIEQVTYVNVFGTVTDGGTAAVAWSTTATSDSFTATDASEWAALALSFPKTNLTLATKQLYVMASEDDGQNWTPAPATFSAKGFGDIRASTAVDGILWVTTDRGLYQVKVDEQETISGERILNVAIAGPEDTWALPPTDNLGKWLVNFEKALYFPVGATIRRYVPGGLGQQVWPSSRWGTVTGDVQAMVGGEGGVYFGAAGYLWCYDGRGFHQLATEPASGALDYLYWHAGKLYVKSDPADYFNFIYPSTRPDINDLTADYVTTGYMVTSMLDFEKVSEIKVIRSLQTQVRFSVAANSGTVTLDYYNGCTTGADPGRIGGGATSLTWVNVGTHALTDGYVKNYTLGTPINCYRLYLRATLTPGTSGYPILEGAVVNGRTIMPRVRRFVVPIAIATDTRDRQGGKLYDTPTDIATALAGIQTDRDTQTQLTMIYDDGTADGESVLVTPFALSVVRDMGDDRASLGFTATITLDEIPS